MEYTPNERLTRLWELSRQNPDCKQCEAEMRHFEFLFREYLEERPGDREIWSYPVSVYIFFNRMLEVASQEMRFPEEQTD